VFSSGRGENPILVIAFLRSADYLPFAPQSLLLRTRISFQGFWGDCEQKPRGGGGGRGGNFEYYMPLDWKANNARGISRD